MTDIDDKFDHSDVLDEVLDIAAEVLGEYAGIPGTTRIERLAQYVAGNLGGPPYASVEFDDENPTSSVRRFEVHDSAFPLVTVGAICCIELPDKTVKGFCAGTDAARAFATAMLRAVELMEK